MEIWRDIQGYEGLYQVSNLGNVRSLLRGVLTPKKCNYLSVQLYKGSRYVNKTIHRLVAETFIPNPNHLPVINHKNENKTDNRVENLEWCTNKYNMNYGTATEKNKDHQPNKKQVMVDDIIFRSMADAANYLQCNVTNLSKAFKNGKTIYKGHRIERIN